MRKGESQLSMDLDGAAYQKQAISLFGRRKVDAMLLSYRKESRDGTDFSGDKLEYVLRSQGLTPSLKEMEYLTQTIQEKEGKLNTAEFLSIDFSDPSE
jgi:hypothetical protein